MEIDNIYAIKKALEQDEKNFRAKVTEYQKTISNNDYLVTIKQQFFSYKKSNSNILHLHVRVIDKRVQVIANFDEFKKKKGSLYEVTSRIDRVSSNLEKRTSKMHMLYDMSKGVVLTEPYDGIISTGSNEIGLNEAIIYRRIPNINSEDSGIVFVRIDQFGNYTSPVSYSTIEGLELYDNSYTLASAEEEIIKTIIDTDNYMLDEYDSKRKLKNKVFKL